MRRCLLATNQLSSECRGFPTMENTHKMAIANRRIRSMAYGKRMRAQTAATSQAATVTIALNNSRILAIWLLILSMVVPAFAQTGTVAPSPLFVAFDNSGVKCSLCKLYTYSAGTTTPLATYTDSSLTVANANPTILDSAGRAAVFLSATSYKFVLKTAADVTLWSVDNVKSTAQLLDLDIPGTAGEDLAAGKVAYLSDGSGGKTAGRWYLADADFTYASSAALVIGMVPTFINSGSLGLIRVAGHLTLPSATMVAGDAQFVSTTAGSLTNTAPTNIRLVGLAETTQILFIPISSAGTAASVDLTAMPYQFGGSALYPTVNTTYPAGATYDKLSPSSGVLSIDSAILAGGTYKLEAVLAVEGAATVTLALVNLTDGAPDTPMVTVTSTSATGERVLSSAITFAGAGSAKVYGVKLKSSSASFRAWAWAVRIIRTS